MFRRKRKKIKRKRGQHLPMVVPVAPNRRLSIVLVFGPTIPILLVILLVGLPHGLSDPLLWGLVATPFPLFLVLVLAKPYWERFVYMGTLIIDESDLTLWIKDNEIIFHWEWPIHVHVSRFEVYDPDYSNYYYEMWQLRQGEQQISLVRQMKPSEARGLYFDTVRDIHDLPAVLVDQKAKKVFTEITNLGDLRIHDE